MAIITNVNARKQLLRKILSFGSSKEEMVHCGKLFVLVYWINFVLFGIMNYQKTTNKTLKENKKKSF